MAVGEKYSLTWFMSRGYKYKKEDIDKYDQEMITTIDNGTYSCLIRRVFYSMARIRNIKLLDKISKENRDKFLLRTTMEC